jgi:ribosomal protein S18 acetylase RimI-like enzyme
MPDTSVTIRAGTVADYPRAHAVIKETFSFHQQAAPTFFQESDSPPPTLATIEAVLDNDSGAWFLAEHQGEVIGFVTVQMRPPAQEQYLVPESRALVQNLGVLSAWRGQGIGQTLMEAAEAWARRHGATRLVLNVWEFNTGALGFYETLGYRGFSRNMWKAL